MELHYQLRGEPTRPAVVLLHGLFGDGTNLGQQARALSERFFVISPDLRNHGRSPWQSSMSYPDQAADVLALADQLDLPSFALLGHSMGGKVAMQVALTQPERVSQLVVADIAPVQYSASHQAVFNGLTAVQSRGITDRRQAERQLAEFIVEPGVRQFLLKALSSAGWRFNVDGLKAAYSEILAAPRSENRFSGPTLFIKGSESDYLLPEHQNVIHGYFPRATAKVLQGAGHWLHAEKPALFNRLVEQFFSPVGV